MLDLSLSKISDGFGPHTHGASFFKYIFILSLVYFYTNSWKIIYVYIYIYIYIYRYILIFLYWYKGLVWFYDISTIVCFLMLSPAYIYIYIYVLSSTDRPVSFYQNSSVWLDRLDSRSWDRNLADWNANPRFYHSATRKPVQYIY